MKKKQKVEWYYEAELCECGGTFSIGAGHSFGCYKCDKCGTVKRLNQEDFPAIKYNIIEDAKNEIL